MRDRNFRGDRLSWQPWFDLHPPTYEQLAAVITAIDDCLLRHGFERGPFGFEAISEDAPLHMRASWARDSLIDQPDSSSIDNASVWGSGLIRIDVDSQCIELTFRDTEPETLAAIVSAHVQAADAPYR
ncbi:hypothetical protein [Nocardia carnea]|uniref:hypothetical protein n=1 Tax=Nocardia carnea TaxID=37328 RepID=UPI0002D5A84C|nr:hypothetical protein [Nocardia carnea]